MRPRAAIVVACVLSSVGCSAAGETTPASEAADGRQQPGAPHGTEQTVRDSLVMRRLPTPFERVTAVDVAPGGATYVSDAGRDAVLRLDVGGRVVGTLGGPGSDAARFDSPGGLDVTNGLVLLVADVGNGRIQRFSADGRFLELQPIGADPTREAAEPTYLERDAGLARASDGRPTDVVTTDDGRLAVIESVSSTVRIWDRERRRRDPVGVAVGDVMPVRPVALATDGRVVFVADPGLPGIVVLDTFGRPTRAMGQGRVHGIVSVAFGDGCVWALLPGEIATFTPSGRLLRAWVLPVRGPAVDLAVRDGRVYVATPTGLYTGAATCEPGD